MLLIRDNANMCKAEVRYERKKRKRGNSGYPKSTTCISEDGQLGRNI